MTGPRRFTVAQRRARLAVRHGLAAPAATPADAARSVVAVHGTDPSSAYLGILARLASGTLADVDAALYADRSLIRLLGMRRTVFLTTLDTAALIQAACSDTVAARERRKLLGYLAESGVTGAGGAEAWLAGAEQAALRALAARGEATAADLAGDDPRLAEQIVLSRGARYEGRQSVSSRVLFLLAAQGQAVRARPRGGWTSHQYRWAPLTAWCPDGLARCTAEDAAVELARRWLRACGPATPEDLAWWTGWTKTAVRAVLTALRPAEADLDGVPGIVLPDDTAPVPAPEPRAALLPGLDSTPMSWQRRDWFLGEHAGRMFDANGNAGPTLWWDGRVVGGWSQDRDGEIVLRFLDDCGADAVAAAEAAAERLSATLGGVRLSARSRGMTSLEQELAGA